MGGSTRFVARTAALSLSLVLATTQVAGAAQPDPYSEECGSCHIAYPAKLMPKADWSGVLGQLDRHFGVDASLDAATLHAVAQRLGVPAPVNPTGSKTSMPPRISTQPWFQKEHREIPVARFRSPAVKSVANCSACHAGAERGVFEGEEGKELRGHDHD